LVLGILGVSADIKLDLREMVIDGANWIQLAQDPVAGFCEYGDESSGSIKKEGYFFIS
jgi:hypothetical protein